MRRELLLFLILATFLPAGAQAFPTLVCDNGVGGNCGGHCPITDIGPHCFRPIDCTSVWGCGGILTGEPAAPQAPDLGSHVDRVEREVDLLLWKLGHTEKYARGAVDSLLP